jgi:hypothetical protein
VSGTYATVMGAMWNEINALGLRVTDDPMSVNPPCVVIDPPSIDRLTMGHYNIRHQIHIVAPGGTGTADALATLDSMLDILVDALDPSSIEPSTYTLGSTGDGAPALTLTLERSN